MLFAIKNRLGPTLLLLIVFVFAAIWLRNWLGLTWSFDFQAPQWRELVLAIAVMAASDGLLHEALLLVFDDGVGDVVLGHLFQRLRGGHLNVAPGVIEELTDDDVEQQRRHDPGQRVAKQALSIHELRPPGLYPPAIKSDSSGNA